MIKRIKLGGLGCFREVDVRLGNLTLLLGPNASGKSTFLRGLALLSKAVRNPVRSQFGPLRVGPAGLDDLVFRHRLDMPITIEVWLDDPDKTPNYSLELSKVQGLWNITKETICWKGFTYNSSEPFSFRTERRGTIIFQTPGTPPRHATLPFLVWPYREDREAVEQIRALVEVQREIGYVYPYHVNPVNLTNPSLPPWIRGEQPYVDTTGLGFTHVFASWKQSIPGNNAFREKVFPKLGQLFPHILDVGTKPVAGKVYIEYQTNRAKNPVPAYVESDGVNLSLFYLTIPHIISQSLPQGESVSPLCLGVEEPETGTHPDYQKDRVEFLRQLSQGTLVESPIQVVATSHSVDIVRWVRPDEALDVLRFVEFLNPEEGSRIYRLNSQTDIDRILDLWEGDVGAAWYSKAFG